MVRQKAELSACPHCIQRAPISTGRDELDLQTGIFTYYRITKNPDRTLHQTARSGNLLLRDTFAATHGSTAEHKTVPAVLLPSREPRQADRSASADCSRPGAESLVPDDELAAIWRSQLVSDSRITGHGSPVLDVATVRRTWIAISVAGIPAADATDCPSAWSNWR